MNLRKIHLCTGLFLLIFLLAYAISAVDFAHRKWLPHPHWTTEEIRSFAPGIKDARVLARQWRGELTSVETLPGRLKFSVATSLGRTMEVTYSIASGEATIRTTTVSLLTTLAYIHVSHGIWTAVVAVVSMGLLTLGVTGIYLWFRNRSERRVGIALLVIGAGIPIALIILMRLS